MEQNQMNLQKVFVLYAKSSFPIAHNGSLPKNRSQTQNPGFVSGFFTQLVKNSFCFLFCQGTSSKRASEFILQKTQKQSKSA